MDEYVDNRHKQILWDLLASPADNGTSYAQSLAHLANEYPQSGILQILYARAADAGQLSKAAIYTNPRALYKIVNHPEDLPVVDSTSIIYDNTATQHYYSQAATTPQQEVEDTTMVAEISDAIQINLAPENLVAEEGQTSFHANEEDAAGEQPEIISQENAVIEEPVAEAINDAPAGETGQNDIQQPEIETLPASEQLVVQETVTLDDQEQELLQTPPQETYQRGSRFPKREVPPVELTQPEYPQQEIDDEVYDEIVSIEDIGFENITHQTQDIQEEEVAEARFSDPTAEDVDTTHADEPSPVLFHQPQPVVEPLQDNSRQINEEEERLILGGIVNADYLLFDKKLDELRNTPPAESIPAEQPEEAAADTHEVARYDDDKMPYTFLWWLNKTRKEHAGNLQPYAMPAQAAQPSHQQNKADELQQQYYENIFSLTTVSGIDSNDGAEQVAFDPNKKEDVIVERFIQTEPQIKPLSADKLDNENKAKKSSEDLNDLVTETLARIYTEQMLYHKAIATYKKLMLKMPEKKTYFAARIEELEKKTN